MKARIRLIWQWWIVLGMIFWLSPGLAGLRPAQAQGSILYAAPDGATSGNCDSWTNACTLSYALSRATSGNEIWVKAGVHYPGSNRTDTFTLKNGVALYGGFAGTENRRDERNWRANLTILSGDIDQNDTNTDDNFIAETWNDIQGSNAYHVVTGSGTDSTAVLDGFIITAGQAGSEGYPDCYGGGMINIAGSPTLRYLRFQGNYAAKLGGGMYNGDSSQPALTGVDFISNFAVMGGGGMANDRSSPVLEEVNFTANRASYPGYPATGGGMYNISASPILERVTFRANVAVGLGGGMFNDASAPSLTNVLFDGNQATSGGGMYNQNSSSPLLLNVTFSGNRAENDGGGMYNGSSSPTLRHVILWGNHASGNGAEIYNVGTVFPVVAYSDIQGCIVSGVWQNSCGSDDGGNIDADPLFVNASGGDFHLYEGSPAIDAGNNTFVSGIAVDLDGNGRVQDGNNDSNAVVDMGAYEAPPDSRPPTIVSITRADPDPTNADRVTFAVTFSEPVTDVDTDDFTLTVTGLSGASVESVSPNTTRITYNVVVSTGDGEGTIHLDIPAGATITDLANNFLSSGLPYQSGETYTIDRTPPEIVSITCVDPNPTSAVQVRFQVAFSEAMANVDVESFALTTDIAETSILDVSTADEVVYTVTVDTGIGNGTLRLDIPDTASITDRAGNSLSGLPYSGASYTVNKPAPNLISPANNATLPNRRPTLDWRNFPGASAYQLQIARNSAFTLGLVSVSVTASERAWPSDLLARTRYYWRVRAKVGATYTPWSEVWSFTTANPPSIPALVSPASNALVTTTPTFDWGNSTVPSGTTFDKYEIQIATDAGFTAPVVAYTSGVTASQYTPGVPLTRATKYYWRVRAWNTAGEYSSWSAVWTVRVKYAAPTLQAPADGANKLQPTFQWDAVAGATGYTLQVSKYANLASPVINKVVSGTVYNHSANLAAGTYYWRVAANGAFGPGEWSEVRTFTAGAALPVPVLASPANNALVTTTPTFDWANVTVPSGMAFDKYEIQIATDAGFTAPVVAYTSGVTASQYTPGAPLTAGTKYYWRVRAWNGAGVNSAWSAVWTVRVKYAAPALQAPADGANNLQPTFRWDAVAGATGYTLQVSKYANLASPVINKVVSGTVYNHSANLAAGTYYWRVAANGAFGPGEWSEVRTFTAGAALPVPVLASPANNALVTTTPTFDWANVTVPSGMAFDKYEIQIATDAGFTAPVVAYTSGVTASQYTPAPGAPLTAGTKYYWRVRAWNGAGVNSAWSAVWTVRVKYAAPANAQVTVTAGKPTFRWDAVAGASGYTLQLSKSNTFGTLLLNRTQSGTSYTYTALPAGTYYWRVRANGAFGPGEWFSGSFVVP
jgi:hypothetical protein